MVAPLSEVSQEGSSVFSLFTLTKLHLASNPLASSYSRATVSSVFCAQNNYFRVCGAPFSMHRFRAAAVKKQSDSNRDSLLKSGGEGLGSRKSPYTASVPETFDALENRVLFGTLGGKDGTQLLRGAEIWLARARFVLGLAPTVPSRSQVRSALLTREREIFPHDVGSCCI